MVAKVRPDPGSGTAVTWVTVSVEPETNESFSEKALEFKLKSNGVPSANRPERVRFCPRSKIVNA